ncbi:hypothetical protein BDV96DRAFT_640054 [Lophiotrema nucula]|uniref:Uncharacterized protein n=1 Tax=Lophiotrema nucula TaxID=690887 RepID=A0A6A5ZSE3_9PLEO|nr:hypothetical protein BDV96DRAFT_640054 [Lophiotrema nucula]
MPTMKSDTSSLDILLVNMTAAGPLPHPQPQVEPQNNTQTPSDPEISTPSHIRIVFKSRGTFYSDLIEVPPTTSETELEIRLQNYQNRGRSPVGRFLKTVQMTILMQRSVIDAVSIAHNVEDCHEQPGTPHEVHILAMSSKFWNDLYTFNYQLREPCHVPLEIHRSGQRRMALFLTARPCHKLAVLWFVCALIILVLE